MPKILFIVLATICAMHFPAWAQKAPQQGKNNQPERNGTFQTDVPAHTCDLILARPTDRSITLSLLAYQDMEVSIRYGLREASMNLQTPMQKIAAGKTALFVLKDLKSDSTYSYAVVTAKVDATLLVGTFHTARARGQNFTFTMTADCHLDEHTSPGVYLQTLANISVDQPDFHIDLGNLFMTDKHASRDDAAKQYLAQRYYLGKLGAPVYLALGTHDGESGKYNDGKPDSLFNWSTDIRQRYFPNPVADGFYSAAPPTASGAAKDRYYAWNWGDALFIVLDAYSNTSPSRGGRDGWDWTLGQAQYQWLRQTLATRQARFKFIFIHNLLSGDQASRGGIEIASFNEWGGKNSDGSEGFAKHRPGWELPVHQLLLKHHVSAVFRAHDNFYARQELDGIAYIMIPQPSFAGNDRIRDLDNYGYKTGVFRGNAGHVRVQVSPAGAKVDYIRAITSASRGSSKQNGDIDDSCTLRPMNFTATQNVLAPAAQEPLRPVIP